MREVPHAGREAARPATKGCPSANAMIATPIRTKAVSKTRAAHRATTPMAGKGIERSGLNNNFDHSKTKYPLVGKHLTVECEACHAKGDFKKELAFAKCTDCHKDDHNGQFAKRADGIECSSCHKVDGWKPSLFDVKAHAKTDYPLVDGHAKVKCDSAISQEARTRSSRSVKFKRCTDCHKDEHNNQFAGKPYENQCDQCHNLKGYSPSTFTLAQHKKDEIRTHRRPRGDPLRRLPQVGGEESAEDARFPITLKTCHARRAMRISHHGQFQERMVQGRRERQAHRVARPAMAPSPGTNWTLSITTTTSFTLAGAHRAVACIDCHKPPNLETKMHECGLQEGAGKMRGVPRRYPRRPVHEALCQPGHAVRRLPQRQQMEAFPVRPRQAHHFRPGRRAPERSLRRLPQAVQAGRRQAGPVLRAYSEACADCHGPEVKPLKKG